MSPALAGGPVQPSLRRLRQFGVRPQRQLGQNFLIDSNILDVVGRAADLSPEDVVLEIGGGLGVLSEYLAERVRHLHVIEIDRHLSAALGDATDPFANVTVHWADVMDLDLGALLPAPTSVVANLPYGVAARALLRTIEQLPTVQRWVAMVQREVGERLAASKGGATYGASSVLAQLAGEVKVVRAIPRSVFFPVPNVDSVLVAVARTGPAPPPPLRALVTAAFAHRRKALAGSLMLAGAAAPSGEIPSPAATATVPAAGDIPHPPAAAAAAGGEAPNPAVPHPARDSTRGAGRALSGLRRDEVRAALVELGHPPDARAQTLSPADFSTLARALGLL